MYLFQQGLQSFVDVGVLSLAPLFFNLCLLLILGLLCSQI